MCFSALIDLKKKINKNENTSVTEERYKEELTCSRSYTATIFTLGYTQTLLQAT